MHDNIHTAIQAGRQQTQEIHQFGFKPSVAMHQECKLVPLVPEKLPDGPRFLTADVMFYEPDQFIAYLESWQDQGTRVWYNEKGEFQAIIDFHRPPLLDDPTDNPTPSTARYGDHIARLHLQSSPEWMAWLAKNEKPMGQVEFAEFIEDQARDIVTPDPVTMLQVATGLQANQNCTLRSAINQANGSLTLAWDQQVEGRVQGSNQEIPAQFQIGIRPFVGCARYPVDCRLRYRIDGGKLKMHYEALHLDVIAEDALAKVVEQIAKETALPVAMGACKVEAIKAGM